MENCGFEIPASVCGVLNRLSGEGYQAYLVGGCVRDMVLGNPPYDWDIATSALPEQIKALFERTIDTGLRHGTVTVLLDGQSFEVTTFRKETGYSDHRHPDRVVYVDDLTEDLARRDFTVNAMAYGPDIGLIDPFDGLSDCEKQLLRCVGDAERRFNEDALRILRGLRFAARLGFTLEDATSSAMSRLYPLLREVSPERIQSELNGLLLGKHLTVGLLKEYREIIGFILPELRPTFDFAQNSPHHAYDVYRHLCYTAAAAAQLEMPEFPQMQMTIEKYRLELMLGALLHDVGKPAAYFPDENGIGHFHGHAEAGVPLARAALTRLKYSNRVTERVLALVEGHEELFMNTEKAVNKLILRYGPETVQLLQAIHLCDLAGRGTGKESNPERQESLRLCACMEILCEEGRVLSLRTLAVNGNDLLALGCPPGKTVGTVLNLLLKQVLEEELPNERGALLAASGKYLEKTGTVKKNT